MLDEITFLAAPYDPPETKRTWQSYCVRLSAEAPLDRTELQLPHTEAAAREVLMLPRFADLTLEHQDYAISG